MAAVMSTSLLIRGRPQTVTAWAPNRYQRSPLRRRTGATAASTARTAESTDTAQACGNPGVHFQVLGALLRRRPIGPQGADMQAQSLADRERLGGRKPLLALTPEAPFGLLDKPPVPPGEGFDVVVVQGAILPPGADRPVGGASSTMAKRVRARRCPRAPGPGSSASARSSRQRDESRWPRRSRAATSGWTASSASRRRLPRWRPRGSGRA